MAENMEKIKDFILLPDKINLSQQKCMESYSRL